MALIHPLFHVSSEENLFNAYVMKIINPSIKRLLVCLYLNPQRMVYITQITICVCDLESGHIISIESIVGFNHLTMGRDVHVIHALWVWGVWGVWVSNVVG